MVLEARYKAEEVWYWLIGEDNKLPNEVWYNINWEITKDASAVENANNQTTTGMANQIPWINSPKLFASTSIIWWAVWWGKMGELYCKGTWFPWGSMSDFNILTVNIASSDISLNPSYPSRIYLREWTYLICVRISLMRNSDYTYTMFCVNDRLILGYVPSSFSWESNFTTTYTVADWWYLELSINPASTSNSAEAIVRLVKLN